MFEVFIKSAGGVKKHFEQFETEAEAESFCREYGWEWTIGRCDYEKGNLHNR